MKSRFRSDVCRVCGGQLLVLAWAKRKPRTCYGCVIARRNARRAARRAVV